MSNNSSASSSKKPGLSIPDGRSVMAFYKGTSVPFPLEMDKFNEFQKLSKMCVETSMKFEGLTLAQIRDDYLEQLNELEEP